MNPRWLFRMARLAHRPPSERQVKVVLGVIAACLLLFAVEHFFGWPDWLTAEPAARHSRP